MPKTVVHIKELTPEQETQLFSYRDYWIAKGLQTGETDWDTFDKYMPICYAKAGIKYPTRVVRVSSPLVGGLAAALAEGILRKNGDADGVMDDIVGNTVGGAVCSAVGQAVRDSVLDIVDVNVGIAIDSAVSIGVNDAVSGAVRSAVSTAVKETRLTWHYWLGGQFWIGGRIWGVAFVNFFFDVCKLKLSKDMMERAEAYRKVCESVNYVWPNRDFVIVCARPKEIHRNDRGLLHNTSGKSISYPDGWGLYHLNGVYFDENLYNKVTSGKMPFKEILAIKDIDQRTQAMRFGDVWEFIKYAKGKKLDECAKERGNGTTIRYWLYQFPKGHVFTEKAYYAIYDDLVPGSSKQFMSGVRPCKTVAEAMAWKFQSTPERWLTMTPGKDMN